MDFSGDHMDVESFDPKAHQACSACRRQKRKCDKALPSCSLCVRMSRACDYSDFVSQPNADDFAILKQKVTELEFRLGGRRSDLGWNDTIRSISQSPNSTVDLASLQDPSAFPTAFFLDAEVFTESNITMPKPASTVPTEVANALGTSILDIQDIVDRYFSNIHTWLPVVSKKRMELTLSNPSLEMASDFSLLLLTMKLVTQLPSGGPQGVRSPLYSLAKRFFAVVESTGVISYHSLQASILISVYEIGHGIYPAAYMTTGHSARLGHALGLNDRRRAPQMYRRKGASWAEVEELGRTWWAVMLLDRYVNLGSYGHPLATGDPPKYGLLPVDDTMWDAGKMATSEPLYVSSPTKVRAGPFARSCQATHLLGRLIHLLNDNLLESPMRFTEAIQLHRTLQALAKLIANDVSESPAQFGTAIALCYSGLIHLCDPFACTASNRGEHTVEETEMQSISIAGMQATANDVLKLSQIFQITMKQRPTAISPLVIECLYSAAATFAWQVHETGSREAAASYHSLRTILEAMDCRWAVAGHYLSILNKSLETLYPQTSLLSQPLS